ncbi:MAG: hypothetical protein WBG86_20780, partial [Polyangiales bacterium]
MSFLPGFLVANGDPLRLVDRARSVGGSDRQHEDDLHRGRHDGDDDVQLGCGGRRGAVRRRFDIE